MLFLSFQNGNIRQPIFYFYQPSKIGGTASLIEQFQYHHMENGRDLCRTKDTSTGITDIVVNEAIIHTGIDRRSRSPARS